MASHIPLTNMLKNILDYEVWQPKVCLLDHNIIFRNFCKVFSTGWDNSRIINTIGKYYDMARNGYDILTYLKSD
jgi:hypothetical protein